jgi:(S)-ureidoglycine aminohydrolase
MRTPEQLVHSRTRVCRRYALMPLEGYPASCLPGWPACEARVLASPALGANFVQFLIDVPAGGSGGFEAEAGVETFYFVLSGKGECRESGAAKHALAPGGFGLLPPGKTAKFTASAALRLLILRKQYEPAAGIKKFAALHGNESKIKKEIWGNNPQSLLQSLIPDDTQYDMAMNIFNFEPGSGLPIVETHVMEHGLLFLQGKGMYYLGGDWMEVEKDDFIWMGPYCPQSFYATGRTASRYIYYKNVNRDIRL